MRTEKKYGDTVTLSEWKKDVEVHYSAEKQQERVDETINHIVKYCHDNFANKKATFQGVWGFLDVELPYLRKFRRNLKKTLKVHLRDAKVYVVYNQYGNDVNVRWEL